MEQSSNTFIWDSEVRSYEIDAQGIVNNANFLHYFDHVRVKHLLSRGINWEDWHKNGLNLVISHVDMSIKSPLLCCDKFRVISMVEKSSRIKILFKQKMIRLPTKTLVAYAENTVVCVSSKTARPVFPKELEELLFSS